MSRKVLVALAVGSFAVFMYLYMNRADIPLANEAYHAISQLSTETLGYLKNPISIVEQFQQHAMGYTAIGSFVGGIAVAASKWVGGKAVRLTQQKAEATLNQVTGQLTSKIDEVEKLTYQLDRKDEVIEALEQLDVKRQAKFKAEIVDFQQKFLSLEERNKRLQTENNTLSRTIQNSMKEKRKVIR